MVLVSFMVWRGTLVHVVWVGSLQGAGFPLVSVAGLEGPFDSFSFGLMVLIARKFRRWFGEVCFSM